MSVQSWIKSNLLERTGMDESMDEQGQMDEQQEDRQEDGWFVCVGQVLMHPKHRFIHNSLHPILPMQCNRNTSSTTWPFSLVVGPLRHKQTNEITKKVYIPQRSRRRGTGETSTSMRGCIQQQKGGHRTMDVCKQIPRDNAN